MLRMALSSQILKASLLLSHGGQSGKTKRRYSCWEIENSAEEVMSVFLLLFNL